MQTKTLSLTRILLLCGAIAGPLFILTVLIQDYTVPAFNPRLQALSLLSLGEWGWVQIVNFVLAGVLNLLYAGGRRAREGYSQEQSHERTPNVGKRQTEIRAKQAKEMNWRQNRMRTVVVDGHVEISLSH